MAEGEERIEEEQEILQEEEPASPEHPADQEEEQKEENAVDTNSELEDRKEEEVMEEREEKVVVKEESKFLTYAAVGLAIVALFFSFWGFGTQMKEQKLEAREAALEKTVANLSKTQLASDFSLKASQVYMLTMVDHNYAAAQKVVEDMKSEAAAFGEAGAKLNALLNALEAEVKKGPSPIPGLVSALNTEVKNAVSGTSAAPVAKAEAKPAPKVKTEKAPAAEKVEKAEQKVEKKAEVKKEEAAPAKKKVLAETPRPAKDAGGLTGSMFHMWQKLSPYSDAK